LKDGIKELVVKKSARLLLDIDMTSGLVVSGRFTPWRQGEQGLAEEQFKEVCDKMNSWGQKRILFVYDRGYPSKKFFEDHFDLESHFLFRLSIKFNNKIDEFVNSGLEDVIIIWRVYNRLFCKEVL
jgi:hypothetical protein